MNKYLTTAMVSLCAFGAGSLASAEDERSTFLKAAAEELTGVNVDEMRQCLVLATLDLEAVKSKVEKGDRELPPPLAKAIGKAEDAKAIWELAFKEKADTFAKESGAADAIGSFDEENKQLADEFRKPENSSMKKDMRKDCTLQIARAIKTVL